METPDQTRPLSADKRECLIEKLTPFMRATLFDAGLEDDYVLYGIDWPGLETLTDAQLIQLARNYHLPAVEETSEE